MKGKKSLLTIGLVLTILTITIVWYFYPYTPPSEEEAPDQGNPEPIFHPEFTIPEAPIGPLTILIVCLTTLAIHSRIKTKRLI